MPRFTSPLYRLAWLSLLLLTFGFAGCTNTEKEQDPAPTTGAVTGVISPVGAISAVTATNAGGLTFLATPNASTGAFSLPKLDAGSYTLSFTPANGYKQPAPRSVTVTAGNTTDAGTIVAVSDGTIKGGTVGWSIGGVTYTGVPPTGSVDVANGIFFLSAIGGLTDQLQLSMGMSFYGVGNYPLGTSPYVSALYIRNTGPSTLTYGTTSNSGSGSINVTAFDATAGTAAGTFSFTAVGTAGNVSVTNGTFSLRF
ncbi:carboxypeptidase regulatory-like domain-containing protein [Hymenobacter busanensis]|uniref:Carboxypeptidase regulatory-like domain-containing protein n=1 Tax=Hymenobacter busanensis TaxID=2607656 RepID=A0A7L4ZT18_9BACT|nr:DUF6252 family protein [Hymenobacter busanensis]KAA9325902.1 carboxypeptidase regulatory-like domain-containing protein [Hymenobacter busanensis]QHJ06258.1 hypothetical protein GUY19_02675 [Hymenobacter busanensis]